MLRFMVTCFMAILLLVSVSVVCGAATPSENPPTHQTSPDTHVDHSNLGETLPLWSCVPFAGMLLSIALFPLLFPSFWHHHFGKISAFWALCLGAPFLFAFKGVALYEILHIVLADYVPFIILLWSLYTISGGILLRGTLTGTPMINVIMLIIGTLLASWMGTTGAAMLMIRPFLRANSNRKNRTFMVVFFIFLQQFQSYQYKRNLIHYNGMNREVYWKSFLSLKWHPDFWTSLTLPDYDLARKGIYVFYVSGDKHEDLKEMGQVRGREHLIEKIQSDRKLYAEIRRYARRSGLPIDEAVKEVALQMYQSMINL